MFVQKGVKLLDDLNYWIRLLYFTSIVYIPTVDLLSNTPSHYGHTKIKFH